MGPTRNEWLVKPLPECPFRRFLGHRRFWQFVNENRLPSSTAISTSQLRPACPNIHRAESAVQVRFLEHAGSSCRSAVFARLVLDIRTVAVAPLRRIFADPINSSREANARGESSSGSD